MNETTSPREAEKANVTILAGFLGAGKTTLLKRILSWETDLTGTAVIVNEFGSVGIDGSMLKDSASDMVEFKSGCVCCVLKAEFNTGLKKLWQDLKPKRILLEASGVADPDGIKKVFNVTFASRTPTFLGLHTLVLIIKDLQFAAFADKHLSLGAIELDLR